MVSSFSSSSLAVGSVPLLKPTFEQPDEGAEVFTCREKTGLCRGDRVKVDKDEAFAADVIGRG
jgi:hypothetical protein